MKKEYVCECGRTFDKPNSFNGHKRNCKIHYAAVEKTEALVVAHARMISSLKKTYKKKAAEYYAQKDKEWAQGKHLCEHCGVVMTKKYGSGRFCSSACAHSRHPTLLQKLNTAEALRGALSVDDIVRISLAHVFPRPVKPVYSYTGEPLPEIPKENLLPGYQSRKRRSYAEKFWKKVLDNNSISYVEEFPVKCKHTHAAYKLDFLIDGHIDLEIDGEQHFTPDGVLKDAERTRQLEEQGFIVYRIRWINPNTEKNKILVKQQIDALLDFISRLS